MSEGRETVIEQLPEFIVKLAVEVAMMSPCRSKRGVVMFKGQGGVPYIYSHGYNYKPLGFSCDGSDACKASCRTEAVHAEQQALLGPQLHAGADLVHVKAVDGALVPSGGPSCVQCSKLILVCGVAGVWLYHADGWRRYEASEFHRLSLVASSPAPLEQKVNAEVNCPDCYRLCGWCSWYAKNARECGCGTASRRGKKCEWEALKGTTCPACGGAEKVRLVGHLEPLPSASLGSSGGIVHRRIEQEERKEETSTRMDTKADAGR